MDPSHPSDSISILIAEDELVSLRRLERTLSNWGHETYSCRDGAEAWEAYAAGGFDMIVTDWIMPELDGLELCRRVRQAEKGSSDYTYIILLTGKDSGLVEGMGAGADDFIAKPFAPGELKVRLQAGRRLLDLRASLARRVEELQLAIDRVQRLEGLLPICSYCKNIRDEDQAWQPVESYVTKRTAASFSHSICPSCYTHKVMPMLEAGETGSG